LFDRIQIERQRRRQQPDRVTHHQLFLILSAATWSNTP
jgi:hypothetical protein